VVNYLATASPIPGVFHVPVQSPKKGARVVRAHIHVQLEIPIFQHINVNTTTSNSFLNVGIGVFLVNIDTQ
jgi:hypothetical protein